MDSSTLQDGMVSTINSGTLSKQPTDMYTDLEDNENRFYTNSDVILEEGTLGSSLGRSSRRTHEKGEDVQDPVFFNVHEVTESYFADITNPTVFRDHDEDHSLCVTHFMNVYASQDSRLFEETRVVRIPRRFDMGNRWYPMFSDLLPGSEPGAILHDTDGLQFVPRGITQDGNVYGYSSVSPLSLYLTQQHFQEIVTTINDILLATYSTYGFYNILNIILEVFTLGLWSYVCNRINYALSIDPMKRLDVYVRELNASPAFVEAQIKLINPRDSGFLSLDFQIPKPKSISTQ